MEVPKSTKEATTTKKSRQFQATPKYGFYFLSEVWINPKAKILMSASKKNRTVNM